jgi:AcrR family transcriptional regulator
MTAAPSQIVVTPRKKPVQGRSRATVEAVLAAAAHILETRGLAGFNTNAVAERAGVSIGSLYQYFPSKDAILVALMEQSLTVFSQTMAEAIDGAPGASLGEDLKFMLQMGLVSHLRRPNLVRLLEDEFQRLEGHINKASSHVAVRAAVIRLLQRYETDIRIDDLEIAAQDVGAIAKTLMSAAGERCDGDWEVVIERIVRAMLGYLDARVGASSALPEAATI